MTILGIDAGSSSIKAAVLRNGRIVGPIARSAFPTRFQDVRAEVDPSAFLKALAQAIATLGPSVRRVDAIALGNMSPSWVAMDGRGKPLTPIVTHQDRRSVQIAKDMVQRVGEKQYLKLAGNLPFPGSISSTTFAWHLKHAPQVMKKADLAGHVNTFLHRQLTGARLTDPSNAAFMGVYSTLDMSGWSDELCRITGISRSILPEIRPANELAGKITPLAAERFGLTAGVPMTTGCVDTSAVFFLVGARPGQLVNVCGSTDVLALCTDRPTPHAKLLTRPLGVGRLWLTVSTLAAAGSALAWIKDQFFADLTLPRFRRLMSKLAETPLPCNVRFEPYLAGDRMSIEQRQAAFTGLTLATTREHLLSAVIESLAAASAARLPLVQTQAGVKALPSVALSGGVQGGLDKVLHRDWTGRHTFQSLPEATLRGLGKIL